MNKVSIDAKQLQVDGIKTYNLSKLQKSSKRSTFCNVISHKQLDLGKWPFV